MSLSHSFRIFVAAVLLAVLTVGFTGCGGSGSNTIYQQVVERASWFGNSIVFASFGGNSIPYIWVMTSSGSGQTVLTPAITAGAFEGGLEPSYSPTGAQIAFCGRRAASPLSFGVYVMPASGGEAGIVRVSPDADTGTNAGIDAEPCWDPTGRVVYTTTRGGGGFGRIVAQLPGSATITTLVDLSAAVPTGRTACWSAVSADGHWLAYTVYAGPMVRFNAQLELQLQPAANIYIKDLTAVGYDATAPGVLITAGATPTTERTDANGAPAFSPTASEIAFHAQRSTNTFDVYRVGYNSTTGEPDAAGPTRLVTAPPGNGYGYPVYSPDGTRILYNGSRQLVSISSLDGSGAAVLTNRYQ